MSTETNGPAAASTAASGEAHCAAHRGRPGDGVETLARLNAECMCVTLDRGQLTAALATAVGDPEFGRRLAAERPTLVSAQPVFLAAAHAERMRAVIAAIESVVATPGYRDRVLAEASELARLDTGARGVFMGYDFHLGANGPRLIEINTNAGGALINAYLAEAQRACCQSPECRCPKPPPSRLEATKSAFVAMFRAEWSGLGKSRPLESIAIVDADPEGQYLHPEFVLFQRLFESHGLAAIIADPGSLTHRGEALFAGTQRIDLVYNRSTDFALALPASAALAAAYAAGAAAVTPNPRTHALHADKRNLALLTDAAFLIGIGIDSECITTLQGGIAATRRVAKADERALWANRDHLFFKSAAGFGSRAAYRGDKVTKRVFADILAGDYVAQELVPPSARAARIDGEKSMLKVDVRNYVYAGAVQLLAARLYKGQVTNMRTPGGGFAPVLVEAA